MSEHKPFSRRNFVTAGAGVAAAVAAPEAATAMAPPPETVAAAPAPAPKRMAAPSSMALPAGRPEAYAYLTAPEVAFLDAAVERLIPTDAHGPGGKEAGCTYYIDQQLAGRYGRGDTMYTQGPWGQALPTQGYQLRYTPAEVYRLGIAATNKHVQAVYKKSFDALNAAHQNDILSGLEKGTITFDDVPAKTFFGMLLGDTIQGFFADPVYGGNRNKIGWKTIGFPGVGAVYLDAIDKQNKPYKVDPIGIADEAPASMAWHDGNAVEHAQTRLAARARAKDVS